MKNNSKKREKILAVATGVLLVALLSNKAIVKPMVNHYNQQVADINLMRDKLGQMKADILLKDDIQSKFEKYKDILSTNMSEQQQISIFSKELNEFYEGLNLKVRSIKILPTEKKEFYNKLAVKIVVKGNVRDIVKFLISQSKGPETIKIEQMDIRAEPLKDHINASILISKIITNSTSQG